MIQSSYTKQKDSQIIRINQRDAHVIIRLGSLAPNFRRSITTSDDIYVQLRSSQFPMNSVNVFDWVRLEISAKAVIMNISTQETKEINYGDVFESQLGITFQPTMYKPGIKSHTYSSDQIVATLNHWARDLIYLGRELYTIDPSSTSVNDDFKILSHLLHIVTFHLDGSGKISTVLHQPQDPNTLLIPWDHGAGFEAGTSIPIDVVLEFKPYRYSNGRQQLYIKDFFGLGQTYTTFDSHTPPVQAQDPLYYSRIRYTQNQFLTLLDGSFNHGNNPFNFPDFFDYTMNVHRYKKFFIHSSLLSNIWQTDGTKTDLLEVVTPSGNFSSLAPEATNTDTRTYQLRDSVGSMQNIEIYIRDEYGDLCEFQDEYELKIGIFFKM